MEEKVHSPRGSSLCREGPGKGRKSGDKGTSEEIGKREGREGHFKKSLGRILQTKPMKYRFIEEHREAYKIKSMCEVMKVSRSGYYAYNSSRKVVLKFTDY